MFFRRLENREKLKKLNSEKGSERSSPFCFFFLYRRSIKPQMEDGRFFIERDETKITVVSYAISSTGSPSASGIANDISSDAIY